MVHEYLYGGMSVELMAEAYHGDYLTWLGKGMVWASSEFHVSCNCKFNGIKLLLIQTSIIAILLYTIKLLQL